MGINQWGTSGNAAFAIPLASATPNLPDLQQYTLAWDPASQLLAWVPVSIDLVTGNLAPAGNLNLPFGKAVTVAGAKVVGARDTGWTPSTGIANKAAFDPSTATFAQIAGAVLGIKNALIAHGLIGA